MKALTAIVDEIKAKYPAVAIKTKYHEIEGLTICFEQEIAGELYRYGYKISALELKFLPDFLLRDRLTTLAEEFINSIPNN